MAVFSISDGRFWRQDTNQIKKSSKYPLCECRLGRIIPSVEMNLTPNNAKADFGNIRAEREYSTVRFFTTFFTTFGV